MAPKKTSRLLNILHGFKWFLFWFLSCKSFWLWIAHNDAEPPVGIFQDQDLNVSYAKFNKYGDSSGCLASNMKVFIMNEAVTFLKNPRPCRDHERIVMVLNHPKAIVERTAIREQIEAFNQVTDSAIRLRPLFLIGTTEDTKDSIDLDEEFKIYGDILQTSAAEGYNRISFKTSGGFVWANCFCSNVNYFIKIDDDVSAHYDVVVNVLEKNFKDKEAREVQCPSVMRNMRPWRPRNSGANTLMGKWSVKTWEMARRVYPSFCPGWMYATTPKMALRLAEMASNLSPKVRLLNRLDDIFMTGFALERVPGAKLLQFHSNGWMGDLWNDQVSYCPFMGISKNIFFNKFIQKKGRYSNGVWMLWCAFYEYFILDNVEFLVPELLPKFVTGLCDR